MKTKKGQKYLSIQESVNLVVNCYKKLDKIRLLIGYESTEITQKFLNFISMATSLGIVLMQHHRYSEAFCVLNKAVKADQSILKITLQLNWSERIVLYCVMAFAFHKQGQDNQALRFVYEIQSFMLSAKKKGYGYGWDLEICSHFITFLINWTMKNFNKSSVYLQLAAEALNSILKGEKSSISDICKKSLYGIISLGLCGVKLIVEDKKEIAISICRKLIKEIEDNAVFGLAKEFLERIENFIKPYDFLESTPTFDLFPESVDQKRISKASIEMPLLAETEYSIVQPPFDEILLTREFEDVFFISNFIHFLTPNVPLINPGELEHPLEDRLPLIEKKPLPPFQIPHSPKEKLENPHAKLIRRILSKKEKPWTQKNLTPAPDIRQMAYLETSRDESKEKIHKIQSDIITNINRSKSISSHRPQNSSPIPVDRLMEVVLKDKEKLSAYRKEALQRRNRHFMVEFSPLRGLDENHNVKVDLIPIHPRYTGSNLGVRYKSPAPFRTKRNDYVFSKDISELSTPEVAYHPIYNF
ncbi:unnamed protein product [Blepharisma stoltei]|uniref:Uncharacterized protein n=1 Tax=Blepharisma stoltei TaxID=1481888 RepID=A0AAU9K5B7_9CILI|nr:unnamed protein product [Blepharisma stoltei]